MSTAGQARSHRLTCRTKKPFPSKMLADNYALLVSWAEPDDPRCQGMEGYLCTCCGEWHMGHPHSVVIRSRHDIGRASSREASAASPTDTADTLGASDERRVAS